MESQLLPLAALLLLGVPGEYPPGASARALGLGHIGAAASSWADSGREEPWPRGGQA